MVKVNVDESHATAARYGVQSVPALLLTKDGEGRGSRLGAMPTAQLSVFIDRHLSSGSALRDTVLDCSPARIIIMSVVTKK